ncbi:MAG: TlpA family protein disulfide reductase [Bacteroidaceae bacterium]|nr:TlpA family protein disulfide reductase [Bacteroidaceae bacterium]
MRPLKKWALWVFILLPFCVFAQNTIHISGHVKFIDETMKMSVYRRIHFVKDTLAIANIDPVTQTYSIDVPFDKPGLATLDCGNWQDVNIWLEDEDLDIDFRGKDTAKIVIKNPPYVYIRGGRNNELMNLVNFDDWNYYQLMIDLAQKANAVQLADESQKQAFSMKLYDANADNSERWTRYLVEHYADCSSVFVPVKRLSWTRDNELVVATLDRLAAKSDLWAQMVGEYRAEKEAKAAKDASIAIGAVAPSIEMVTQAGEKVNLSDFKGKVLVVDFWASWCGPCRKEIPKMKELYNNFDKTEVEFLSISIDSDRGKWLKAKNEEKMPWSQAWVEDGGIKVMDTYMFSGIPYIIVLDKDGKIFRKHLRGDAIREAVEEALQQ